MKKWLLILCLFLLPCCSPRNPVEMTDFELENGIEQKDELLFRNDTVAFYYLPPKRYIQVSQVDIPEGYHIACPWEGVILREVLSNGERLLVWQEEKERYGSISDTNTQVYYPAGSSKSYTVYYLKTLKLKAPVTGVIDIDSVYEQIKIDL